MMQKSLIRKIIMLLLLAACTGGAYYFHFVLGTDIVYTHLFYIPIVLGGLWWGSCGTAIPVFLAVVVVSSHLLSGISATYFHDLVRGAMFIVVGYIVGNICTERKRHVRALKTTNGLKDLFSDIMHHDLLNFISGIDGVCELMIDEDSVEAREEELDIIRDESDRIKKLISDATIFSKLSNAEARGLEKRDLADIVKESVDVLNDEAKTEGIEIVNRVEGQYFIMGNPFLGDVFSNLTSNAIKYSPKGSRVFIDIEDSGASWKVSVKDSGAGISDKYKEDVFHRFQRRDKGGVKGSGLGLAIVEKVVKMHRGRVWVEDNPKGGSVFYVELPKAE